MKVRIETDDLQELVDLVQRLVNEDPSQFLSAEVRYDDPKLKPYRPRNTGEQETGKGTGDPSSD